MRRAIITIGLAVLGITLLSPFAPVQAEQIKIGLTAQVSYIDDPYNLLDNGVNQGDWITGFYIYDSETPDSDSSVYHGSYRHTTTPYGMLLAIGNLTFQTDPIHVNFGIGITNNYYDEPWDYYTVTSYNNLQLNNGVLVDRLHWQLDDYPGTALSSDALPLTAPDLSKWQSNNLSIFGGMYPFPPDGSKTLFQINGTVTSVYLIPEPATIVLFVIGTSLFYRRNFKKD
jgi:hypothetical protein